MQETRNVTLHESSRFQIIPEYGISDVGDYTTSGFNVDYTCEVGIEDAFLLIVFPMNLQKMRAEIVDNSFKIVGAVPKGRDVFRNAHTAG